MKKFLFLMLSLILMGGANSVKAEKVYHTLGGESQAGWSHNMTLTASTSGVSAYKFYDGSKWATFGLMGGYASINVADYPIGKYILKGHHL